MSNPKSNYTYSDIDNRTQNIHLSKVDKDIYYVSCKNLRGDFHINFASPNVARINYHKFCTNRYIKNISRTGCSLNFTVVFGKEFDILCTYTDFQQIISKLRKQKVLNDRRSNQDTFSR